MKQIAQNYKSGELLMLEVPVPQTKPGGLLVRTMFSLISAGTELMKIGESKLSMVGKARARPDQVKKVLQSVAQQGLMATYRKVEARLDSYTPLGYSLVGEVVEVGEGVDEFRVGQWVACGGNQYAFHAEFNWVPINLCVVVPAEVDPRHAAFTTVGAVAMQGFRQSEAVLGESAVVVGLGLVGQLLTQILVAGGVSVVGVDLAPDRCRLAEAAGAYAAGAPDSIETLRARLVELTGGHGADHVFITAGGTSNGPVELAADLARDRGRVIDIGKTKLDLPWTAYYEKELDVRFSRSYGPGRYDPLYEEGGIDYPIGYVRWTERRNMESFVQLIAQKRINLEPLVAAVYQFDDAVATYERMTSGSEPGVGVLFQYSAEAETGRVIASPLTSVGSPSEGRVRLAVVGAGSYASSMLLPHLRSHPMASLTDVVTTSALSAANAQKQFGFERFGTDLDQILGNESVDAVLIATRHASHARLVDRCLRAGKAVFVEKPLALDHEELSAVMSAIVETGNDRLLVGFNRRYSPLLSQLRRHWETLGPVQIRYTVNAGPLAADSWYSDRSEGTRFVGEGGHFIDTATWWVGHDPRSVVASSTSDDVDNLSAIFTYPDGSVATIHYLISGDARYPKESIEVMGQGRVARFDNFRSFELWSRGKRIREKARAVDKGQRQQLDHFLDAVAHGRPMPINVASLVATTAATLAAVEASISGQRCEIGLER